MAHESKTYWTTTYGFEFPPDDWEEVVTDALDSTPFEMDRLAECREWLDSDRHVGEYCWHHGATLRGPSEGEIYVWRFSDPNTAFEFKMRFA